MPLVIDRLSKAFGEKQLFREFCYTFPERGLVAITGRSGCGKTTLLRLIAGLERLDSGRILLPENAKLSFVFQEDRLLPTLDARSNVLAVLGERGADATWLADECLAQCGLKGEEHRFPAQLSGGMRRRVALARAVAFGGELLLLDEPFRGLDEKTRAQVMEFVLQTRNDRLILLVTHDAQEVTLADETLRLQPEF